MEPILPPEPEPPLAETLEDLLNLGAEITAAEKRAAEADEESGEAPAGERLPAQIAFSLKPARDAMGLPLRAPTKWEYTLSHASCPMATVDEIFFIVHTVRDVVPSPLPAKYKPWLRRATRGAPDDKYLGYRTLRTSDVLGLDPSDSSGGS